MINYIRENAPWFYLGFALTYIGGLSIFSLPFWLIVGPTLALFFWAKK